MRTKRICVAIARSVTEQELQEQIRCSHTSQSSSNSAETQTMSARRCNLLSQCDLPAAFLTRPRMKHCLIRTWGPKTQPPLPANCCPFLTEGVQSGLDGSGAGLPGVLDSMMPLASRALRCGPSVLNSPLLSSSVSGFWWRPSCRLRAGQGSPCGSGRYRSGTLSYNRILSPTLDRRDVLYPPADQSFPPRPILPGVWLLHALFSHACRRYFIFLLQAATLPQPRREKYLLSTPPPLYRSTCCTPGTT